MIGPIQPTKIPEKLIYRLPSSNRFRMVDTKTGRYVGEMNLSKRENEMFIDWLNIMPNEKRKGNGTIFLNFAKNISKQMGFNGRLRLMASVLPFDPHNPPHIFYRKYGFTSDDKKVIKKIDKAILKNRQLSIFEVPPTYMYYNPNPQVQVKGSPFKTILKSFSKLHFLKKV